jgi:N-acylneuraminate cytidylyltransferase/CMP-N,N'-diacetyllegionaminic acid synthase
MRRLCTILARGGSKGVPGKNLRRLDGKPMIVRTIEQARDCDLFDSVAVSSDSPEILAAARGAGADCIVERPADMASDEAAKPPAIRHCALEAEKSGGLTFDTVADLAVTSPMRSAADILGAVELQEARGASIVVSAMAARSSPYFNIVECDRDGFAALSKPLPAAVARRQDGPRCYELNGAVYVWRRDALVDDPKVFYPDTLIYEMPADRSIDIDSELDLEFAEFILTRDRSKVR